MTGESTFMVEVLETANILKHATKNSFVVLDELGRGTSTFDGTAIAYSVLQHLSELGCRCLFATHYHMLCEEPEVLSNPRIGQYHMSYHVDGGEEENGEPNMDVEDNDHGGDGAGQASATKVKVPRITFLYKFMEGRCADSFGLNVAALAGIKVSSPSACHVSCSWIESLTMPRSHASYLLLHRGRNTSWKRV